MRVFLESLGCPKNTADSEYMLGLLKKSGCAIEKDPQKADVLIVNTCGFIQPAKEESIDTILELAQLKNKNKKLIVCGCLYERYKKELKKELPEVDAFVGVYELEKITDVVINKKIKPDAFTRSLITPKHLAYVKIGDGCSNNCSFCAIPIIKGGFWSRPMDEIVKEVEYLVEFGVKEINLVAQDTTAYMFEKGIKNGLVELLEKLEKIDKLKWIRLLYTYPSFVTDELIDFMSNSEKLVHYIDVPFQHASDKVLKDMKRGYNQKQAKQLVEKLKAKINDISIRSTFIVGFPTEDDKDFEELIDFLEYAKLDWVGFFPYYHEEGTLSYKLFNDLNYNIKQQRLTEAQNIQSEITLNKNSYFLGKEIEVIIDQKDDQLDGYFQARSYRSAYEIDGVILVKGNFKPGEFAKVKIDGIASPVDLFAH